MGSAKDVWTLLALSYPKQSFTAGFNRMSEAKDDLILLLWRENGLFWFSLDGEQSLSPVFLKASDPGGGGGALNKFYAGRLLSNVQPLLEK